MALWIILIIVTLLLAVCFILLLLNLKSSPVPDLSAPEQIKGTRWEPYARTLEENISRIREYPWEDVWITSHDGLRLHGQVLHGSSDRTVLLAHGYRSSGENDFCGLVDYYRKKNDTILMVDQRAHGKSEGKQLTFGIRERWDMTGWISYAVENLPQELYLHGISMGAVSLMMALPLCKGFPIRGVIADSAYDNVRELLLYQAKRKYHLPAFPFYALISAEGFLLLGKSFSSLHAAACIAESNMPVLIINGTGDHTIPPGMAGKFTRARQVQYSCIEGARHGMCWLTAPEVYKALLNQFIDGRKQDRQLSGNRF